jgi:hypothetical protein
VDPRVRAVEAYVQAVRTGTPSAAERAGQCLSPSVVLVAGPLEFAGREAVLRRITGQWPWTSTYMHASWSDPRADGDQLTVHADFPPMGASPATVDLRFSFDAAHQISRVEQATVMQGAPPAPVADTIPTFVRGIVNGALANGTPMVLSYVESTASHPCRCVAASRCTATRSSACGCATPTAA